MHAKGSICNIVNPSYKGEGDNDCGVKITRSSNRELRARVLPEGDQKDSISNEIERGGFQQPPAIKMLRDMASIQQYPTRCSQYPVFAQKIYSEGVFGTTSPLARIKIKLKEAGINVQDAILRKSKISMASQPLDRLRS